MPAHLEKQGKLKDYIVKGNPLVEAKYKLSVQECRLIFWLLCHIKNDDKELRVCKISIKEFSEVTGLSVDGQYQKIKKVTENLINRSLKIFEKDKNTFLQTSWLSAAFYEFKKGHISLEFSSYLRPYLLQLKDCFTKIEPSMLFGFKSFYSIRIFELLKQHEKIGRRLITIEALREFCGIEPKEYRDYNAVKIYVVKRAIEEINKKTEYDVAFREIKESRRVSALEFTINRRTYFEKFQEEKYKIIEKEIRSKNILIEKFKEYGFSRLTAKKFLQQETEEIIENALKAVNIQVERGNVKNPKAMVRTAIQERWKPDVYLPKKSKYN